MSNLVTVQCKLLNTRMNKNKSICSEEVIKQFLKEKENKNMQNKTTSEIFTELDDRQKDELFDMLLSDRIYDDVSDILNKDKYENMEENLRERILEDVVNDIVYNNKYDLDCSYWNNLTALIEKNIGLPIDTKEVIEIGTEVIVHDKDNNVWEEGKIGIGFNNETVVWCNSEEDAMYKTDNPNITIYAKN